ncbi:MAG: helix-turn-helix transcriptional regulator [Clostridia bacterium]|nr:helix-turn-helix transcriptional regulator [Clostridia bacterium]
MLGTRYEEYTHFENNLPFLLVPDIRITPETRRAEANWHTNLELKLCTEGQGSVLLDTRCVPFCAGDVMVINSNVLHHTNATNALTYTALIVSASFCAQIDINPLEIQFREKITEPKFTGMLYELIETYQNVTLSCRLAKCHRLMLDILIYLKENYQTAAQPQKQDRNYDTIKDAIRFIRENYAQKLSLDRIARAVLTDKFTLSRAFKKYTNYTVVQYINNFRCQKAADLISEGTAVSEAALQCGFTNISFFTKTFKAHLGDLPSHFKTK